MDYEIRWKMKLLQISYRTETTTHKSWIDLHGRVQARFVESVGASFVDLLVPSTIEVGA